MLSENGTVNRSPRGLFAAAPRRHRVTLPSTEATRTFRFPATNAFAALLAVLALAPTPVESILPTAAVDIVLPDSPGTAVTFFASQASFGVPPVTYGLRHVLKNADRGGGVPGAPPAFPPDGDAYLCNESEGRANYTSDGDGSKGNRAASGGVMIVPRGRCSFERKALSAQRLGASAVLIYGSLSSRYSFNYTNSTPGCASSGCDDAMTRTDYGISDVDWPKDKFDYDCDNGRRALLPAEEYAALDFLKMPGGYDERNDDFLTGAGSNNLCARYEDSTDSGKGSFVDSCDSRRCLVTGKNFTDANWDGVRYEACCAWDFHVWLFADSTIPTELESVSIPAVYVTMSESAALLDLVRGAEDGGSAVMLNLYQRYRPMYNVSAVLIWALGVLVTWIASYHSSLDYRRAGKFLVAVRKRNARTEAEEDAASGIRRSDDEDGGRVVQGDGSRARSRSPGSGSRDPSADLTVERGEERTIYHDDPTHDDEDGDAGEDWQGQLPPPQYNHDPDSIELTASHALGFIFMASTSLLVLFFFKIYNVVKIMYAFGCSGAFAQIILHPGMTHILVHKLRISWFDRDVDFLTEERATRAATRGGFGGRCLHCLWQMIGPVTPLDILTMVFSYSIGAVWLYIAFTLPHPGTNTFYWLVQDLFGLCMCVLFLSTIRLNSIRVGSILLIVAFLYDIFFVFVTPLLTKHGESIMVNVATSGGPPTADPLWCEKYPWTADCRGGDPLPMLFAVPRIGDYQGGSSLLGLGDIVLPGLLISFASRYDEAKRLIGLAGGGSGRILSNCAGQGGGAGSNPSGFYCLCCRCCRSCGQGYFGPVIVAYAVGLLMANAAVYLMQMGQPALLYLVPCCLGTMAFLGWRSGELMDLWEGPRVIRAADAMCYGEPPTEEANKEEEEEAAVQGRTLEDSASARENEGANGEAPLLQMT